MTKQNLQVEQMSWGAKKGTKKKNLPKKYENLPWFWNWHLSEWILEQIRKERKT